VWLAPALIDFFIAARDPPHTIVWAPPWCAGDCGGDKSTRVRGERKGGLGAGCSSPLLRSTCAPVSFNCHQLQTLPLTGSWFKVVEVSFLVCACPPFGGAGRSLSYSPRLRAHAHCMRVCMFPPLSIGCACSLLSLSHSCVSHSSPSHAGSPFCL
jgi:hypothetical protein